MPIIIVFKEIKDFLHYEKSRITGIIPSLPKREYRRKFSVLITEQADDRIRDITENHN
jgi:hypothetical protein